MNKPRIICHRGNISGALPKMENFPSYIRYALNCGFDVEVDVWLKGEDFYLGHDAPTYKVPTDFFYNEKLWVHCKNIEALHKMIRIPVINAFFHNEDDATITSRGYIWSYPRKEVKLGDFSVAVMPERVDGWEGLENCYAICSDNAILYKDKFYGSENENCYTGKS